MVTVHLDGGVVEVSYDTLELHSGFGVGFNAIYEMHQLTMNLKI
jgi:hypothetical protein